MPKIGLQNPDNRRKGYGNGHPADESALTTDPAFVILLPIVCIHLIFDMPIYTGNNIKIQPDRE